MTTEKLTESLKWLGRRLGTVGLYVLVIIGASGWDRDPDSWFLILLRLGGTASFLWWAVDRTVTHWHEDQEDA